MEKTYQEKKWYNYFNTIRNKYNMRVSPKKPLVIFLNAKDVTKNKSINLIDNSKDSFLDVAQKTVKYFTKKYNCLAIFALDEVNFIFKDAQSIIDEINNDKTYRTQDIASVFSQYFYEYFNNLNKNNQIYWYCKCYSIPEDKISSYIKYKNKTILKGVTTYFLNKNLIKNSWQMKLEEKIKLCNSNENYEKIKPFEEGILYLEGDKIDIKQYLNGKKENLNKESKEENEKYFDLKMFDDLL